MSSEMDYRRRSENRIDKAFPGFDNRAFFKKVLEEIPAAEDVSSEFDEHPSIKLRSLIIWVAGMKFRLKHGENIYDFIVDIYNPSRQEKPAKVGINGIDILKQFIMIWSLHYRF